MFTWCRGRERKAQSREGYYWHKQKKLQQAEEDSALNFPPSFTMEAERCRLVRTRSRRTTEERSMDRLSQMHCSVAGLAVPARGNRQPPKKKQQRRQHHVKFSTERKDGERERGRERERSEDNPPVSANTQDRPRLPRIMRFMRRNEGL